MTTLNDTFSVQKHEGQLKINPYYIHSSTMSKEILRESRVEVSVFKVHGYQVFQKIIFLTV